MRRVFLQQDVDAFAHLTGDANPIHDADRGGTTAAEALNDVPLVPGMLLASLFPAIIGTTFPGALYLSQTLKFRRPAAVGTVLRAEVTVTAQSGSRVTFGTAIKDASGAVMVDGTALALIKGRTAAAAAQ